MKVSQHGGYFLLFLGYVVLLILFKAFGSNIILDRAFAVSYLISSITAIGFYSQIFITSHSQTRKIISYFTASFVAFIFWQIMLNLSTIIVVVSIIILMAIIDLNRNLSIV